MRLPVFLTAVCLCGLVAAKDRIVVVPAHPDDLIPCFGTCMLSKDIFEWHVVEFTHGERGLGEQGYRDGSTKKIRMAEEGAVCEALGAKLHWLDEVDGEAYASRETCRRLAALLKGLNPRAVFAHWPVDIHGDHAMAGVAVMKALFLAGLSPEVYFIEQEYQAKRFVPDQFVDISDVMDRKCELIRMYKSQYRDGGIERRKIAGAQVNGMHSMLLDNGFAEGFMSFVQPLQGQRKTVFQELPPPKRKSRLRFQGAAAAPATLESGMLEVSVDTTDGKFSVVDKRSRREWKSFGSRLGLSLAFGKADSGRVEADILASGGNVGKTVFRLDGSELEVEVDFKSIPKEGRLFPGPLWPGPEDAAVIPLSEGFRIPFAECDLITKNDFRVWRGDFSMPFFGAVDGNDECGWMAILETPDDASIRCIPEGGHLGAMAPLWMPEMLKAGYPRKVRFVFFDKGGYVAMAKRYREFARSGGLVKTFSEKAKERPMVERLPGAANVWYFPGKGEPSHARVAAELREAGIGRILWSSCAPKADVAKIAAMPDCLVGRYDVCRDVYYPELLDAMGARNPPKSDICRNTSAWPDDIMWDSPDSNAWRRAWGIACKDGKIRKCAAQCDIPAVARLERNVAGELETTPFTARFIDVITAVGWEECWNPAHPMTRRVSRQAKLDLLKMLGDRFSLVVGAEQGKDAVVPYCDYFEGMMSPNVARMPHGRSGYERKDMFRDDGSVPKQLSEKELDRVERYALNEKYRIPLFELVYHDCVASHWYWYDYSNHPVCFWRKRDCFNALYGTAPMYIFDYAQWKERKAEFVESWKRVGEIARNTGFSEMVSHRALNQERTLQETRFANGTVVVVDFITGNIRYGMSPLEVKLANPAESL